MKNTNGQSLRYQVEKWLGPAPAAHFHVTRFGRTGWTGRRYVRVETSSPAGARALFFFRHDDGNWSIFPPPDKGRESTPKHPFVGVSAATF
jgi:hypothetical protein